MESLTVEKLNAFARKSNNSVTNSIKQEILESIFENTQKRRAELMERLYNNKNETLDTYNNIRDSYANQICNAYTEIFYETPGSYHSGLEGVISGAVSQINSGASKIRQNYNNQLTNYCFGEISDILHDKTKSQSQKTREIRLVLDKMKTTANEAKQRLRQLSSLMKSFKKLGEKSIESENFELFYKQAVALKGKISGVSTAPSSLEGLSKAQVAQKNLEAISSRNINELS